MRTARGIASQSASGHLPVASPSVCMRHADSMANCGLTRCSNTEKHHDVHGFAFEFGQRLFDSPLIKAEFLQCLQFRCDLEIDSDASFQFPFQRDQLHGAIAATEFQYLQ